MTTDIKTIAARIAGLQSEIDELKAQIKDELENAASAGFTASALRKAIKVHNMDQKKRAKHDQAQMDFETYLNALDNGNVVRMAAE